jgi:hypothetical protein
MSPEQNSHHLFWTRREYLTHLEKNLREHRGFVLPIDVEAHRELHADLNPPPKPNARQIRHLLGEVGDFQLGRGRLYCVYHAIDFFNVMSHSHNELYQANALDIAEHLETQLHYLTYKEPKTNRRAA